MKAYRVWLIDKRTSMEGLASTAYELEERANEIRDRNTEKNGDWATFETRAEEVPGQILVNGNVFKVNIVVKGNDNEHTRFDHV